MTEPWVPAYQRLFDPDHHLADEPACKRWAWLDLCQMAQYEERTRVVKGRVVKLQKGELLASVRFLADRWRWSKGRVGRFLDVLEHPDIEKIETVRGTPSGTVYRVVSYGDYALGRDSNGDTRKDSGGTPTGTKYIRSRSNDVEPSSLRSEEPTSLAAAVGLFLDRTGAEWRLSRGISEWASEIEADPKYAGADLPYEVRKCADWHVGKGKTPAHPDMSIRNWLEKAAKDAKADLQNGHRSDREDHLRGLGISTGRL